MPRGNHKGLTALALLAALALIISVTAGTAVSSPSGGGQAEVAKKKKKKKCKKGTKKVKKKNGKFKCVKKQEGAKPVSLVRATLTWDASAADLDLWVFDAAGNRARAAGANPIPNSAFSANDTIDTGGLGPETFTDLIFKVPGRAFSFGVCHQDGGSENANYVLTYVNAQGVTQTATGLLQSTEDFDVVNAGAPTPSDFCPVND